ncbi:D-aminoacyl-tRNA deacylase [Shumkonia mesophila]|uniref:D-aminoacyl-tRNA deacylase n=1 Tax=Shumkonia mesophila TaxID=2838854 RepID=UPI0029343A4D|nr:D-aminoacyl-tRNA deacylase [Shumkonia mesophila]
MKAVLQRVKRAGVRVDGATVGSIGRGLLVLLCAERGDGPETAAFLAGKTARLRIFSDPAGKFNLSLLDIGGQALVVSQFTLAGNWRKGNRPSFSDAAPPELAEPLYEAFCRDLRDLGIAVETGRFAAHMEVDLLNDGPVTLWLDSRAG